MATRFVLSGKTVEGFAIDRAWIGCWMCRLLLWLFPRHVKAPTVTAEMMRRVEVVYEPLDPEMYPNTPWKGFWWP